MRTCHAASISRHGNRVRMFMVGQPCCYVAIFLPCTYHVTTASVRRWKVCYQHMDFARLRKMEIWYQGLQVKVSLLGIFGKLVGAYLNNGLAKYLKKKLLVIQKGGRTTWEGGKMDKQTLWQTNKHHYENSHDRFFSSLSIHLWWYKTGAKTANIRSSSHELLYPFFNFI